MTRERPSTRILRDARRLIARPNGWVKGVSRMYRANSKGEYAACYCATGALREVSCGDDWSRKPARGTARAFEVLAEVIGRPRGTVAANVIITWNDDVKRTKKQVLAAFDEAIERSMA